MKSKQTIVLAVARAVDLWTVHPATDFRHTCRKCGHRVAVFPSGKKLLRSHKKVLLLCTHCCDARQFLDAPGAVAEQQQCKPIAKL